MKVVIYGIGPFAELMYLYLNLDSNYEVIAFTADKAFIKETTFCNLPIVAFEEIEKHYCPNEYQMLVTVGYSVMRNRRLMYNKAKAKNYKLINYIHSSVIAHNIEVGDNNIILAGCIIEPNVTLGCNNVIWSMTLLGHDCKIYNHNYISAKCLISGDSIINDLCFIGNGSVMINGITISNETCVGASTYIRKSTKPNSYYVGNPSKLLRTHISGIEL